MFDDDKSRIDNIYVTLHNGTYIMYALINRYDFFIYFKIF